jgi:hypothetical protein
MSVGVNVIAAREKIIQKMEEALAKEEAIRDEDKQGMPNYAQEYFGQAVKRRGYPASLERFVNGVNTVYNNRFNIVKLKKMIKEAKDEVQKQRDEVGNDKEKRTVAVKSIRVVCRNGTIYPDPPLDNVGLCHWEMKTKYQPWWKISERNVRPETSEGLVRIRCTDKGGFVSNVVDIGTVIQRQAFTAKRQHNRFDISDKEFQQRCRGVAQRILRLTTPHIIRHGLSNGFSMRIFQDRVSRLPDHLHKTVAQILTLCETKIDGKITSKVQNEYIKMVEFCEPTIHLNPSGMRRALREIKLGKRIQLQLKLSKEEDAVMPMVEQSPGAAAGGGALSESSEDEEDDIQAPPPAALSESAALSDYQGVTTDDNGSKGELVSETPTGFQVDLGAGNTIAVASSDLQKTSTSEGSDQEDGEEEEELEEEDEEEEKDLSTMKMSELKKMAKEMGLSDDNVGKFGNRSTKLTYIRAIQANLTGGPSDYQGVTTDDEDSDQEEELKEEELEEEDEARDQEEELKEEALEEEDEEEEKDLSTMKMSELKKMAKEMGLSDDNVGKFGNRSTKLTYIKAIQAIQANLADGPSDMEETSGVDSVASRNKDTSERDFSPEPEEEEERDDEIGDELDDGSGKEMVQGLQAGTLVVYNDNYYETIRSEQAENKQKRWVLGTIVHTPPELSKALITVPEANIQPLEEEDRARILEFIIAINTNGAEGADNDQIIRLLRDNDFEVKVNGGRWPDQFHRNQLKKLLNNTPQEKTIQHSKEDDSSESKSENDGIDSEQNGWRWLTQDDERPKNRVQIKMKGPKGYMHRGYMHRGDPAKGPNQKSSHNYLVDAKGTAIKVNNKKIHTNGYKHKIQVPVDVSRTSAVSMTSNRAPGELTTMLMNMSDDWATSDDELFADSSSNEFQSNYTGGTSNLAFADSSSDHDDTPLTFAQESSTSTSEKTSSGMDFAASSSDRGTSEMSFAGTSDSDQATL